MPKKILITGATGFIGSRLADRCVKEGFEVHITVRASSNLWRLDTVKDQLSLHEVDLKDSETLKYIIYKIKPEIIFHLACYGGFSQENNELCMLSTNVEVTHSLLEICEATKLSKFIFVGSSSEYGIKAEPMKESDSERPINMYGVSKLAATNLARLYGCSNRVPSTILRIFSAYGPYESAARLVPTVIKSCLKKEKLLLTSGNQPRDFVFVEDIIDALLLTADTAPGEGEVINIGGGKHQTVKEMINAILQICECPVEPQWGAIPDRKNEPLSWVADITQALEIIQWQPTTSLHDGLLKTVNWFKDNNDA